MTGPDRGRKKDSVSVVVQDVKRILSILGAQNDFNVIYDENTDNIRKQYLGTYCKEKETRPSSIRKYLYSLKDFSKFLKVTEIEFVNLKNVKTAINNIKLWRKNYSKQAKKQTGQERQKEYQMLITPSQLAQYLNSDHAVSALRLFSVLKKDNTYELSIKH